MLENTLSKLGLSDKEAKVYLAALQLGAASVQKIAEKAKINRPTTYVILESLSKKGLATTHEQGKKTLFAAESPERLQLLLTKLEADIKEKKSELAEAMPDLKAIFNFAGNKPRVKFYEGEEGMQSLNEDETNRIPQNATSYSFNDLDLLFKHMPESGSKGIALRLKKNNCVHSIYTRKDGPLADANDDKSLRKARFVPSEVFPFKASMIINPGKEVIIFNYGENLGGVVIEDSNIADAMKAIWDLAWDAAAKYN